MHPVIYRHLMSQGQFIAKGTQIILSVEKAINRNFRNIKVIRDDRSAEPPVLLIHDFNRLCLWVKMKECKDSSKIIVETTFGKETGKQKLSFEDLYPIKNSKTSISKKTVKLLRCFRHLTEKKGS